MAYTKQTWADLPSKTTPINANRLTHIEDGIFNAAATADTAASTAGTAAANIGIVSGRVETLTGRVNGLDTAVSNKVDKVAGKGLSTNDYDNTDKGKVDSLGTASIKNSTSVVTESSDLVESGAVFDALGFGNKNLFNKNDVENGIINESGAIVIVGEWKSSKFIKVTPSEKYIISGLNISYASSGGFAFYNSAKTFVSGGGINVFKHTPITIPDNVEYIRFSLVPADLDTAQLEVGSTVTTYEPYHASVEESLAEKCDNSVIGTVEDGTNPTRAYAVGEHMIRGGKFCTVTVAVTTSSTWTLGSNYVEGTIADNLVKQGTFSKNTNAGGILSFTAPTNNIVGVILDNPASFGVAYIRSGESENVGVAVRSAIDLTALASTAVSGTYYYI